MTRTSAALADIGPRTMERRRRRSRARRAGSRRSARLESLGMIGATGLVLAFGALRVQFKLSAANWTTGPRRQNARTKPWTAYFSRRTLSIQEMGDRERSGAGSAVPRAFFSLPPMVSPAQPLAQRLGRWPGVDNSFVKTEYDKKASGSAGQNAAPAGLRKKARTKRDGIGDGANWVRGRGEDKSEMAPSVTFSPEWLMRGLSPSPRP